MTLHVENIWHTLCFFKKNLNTGYAKYYFWLPKPNRMSTFCRISLHIPQVHLTYKCVFSYSHINSHIKQLKFFDSINVLIRSNYINKYIFKF